jgi:hypothetical protein
VFSHPQDDLELQLKERSLPSVPSAAQLNTNLSALFRAKLLAFVVLFLFYDV